METTNIENSNAKNSSLKKGDGSGTALRVNGDVDFSDVSAPKKMRIVYDREFLLQCERNAGDLKDVEIPPELSILVPSRSTGSPSSSLNSTFERNRKRLEMTTRKDGSRSPQEGVISLRPHSGNFSSGCVPNLSPSHGPALSRFHTQEDQSKSFFDRDFSRNQFRFPNSRLENEERGRGERERGRDDRRRDERGREDREWDRGGRETDRNYRDRGIGNRMSGGNARRNYGQSYNAWGPDYEQSDWNKRNQNGQSHSRREYNGRDRNSRGEEQEPEWFSEGPMTHNDTIELTGFLDDERRERNNQSHTENKKRGSTTANLDVESTAKKAVESTQPSSGDNISLEKILGVDSISNILPNGMLEPLPSGSSRFSQLFQRNSDTPPRAEGNGTEKSLQEENDNTAPETCSSFEPQSAEEAEAVKSKAARDIEVALRNILLTKPVAEQEKVEEDIHAFKKLLDQIIVKGGSKGSDSSQAEDAQKSSQIPADAKSEPESDCPMAAALARLDKIGRSDRRTPPNPLRDMSFANFLIRASELPYNSLRENMFGPRKPPPNVPLPGRPFHPVNMIPCSQPDQLTAKPHQPQRNLTPNQVISLLPVEIQYLVANTNVSPDFLKRPEAMQLVHGLTSGDIVLGDIIQQLGSPQNALNPLFAGVLKLSLQGAFPVPGLILGPVGMGPMFPHAPPPIFTSQSQSFIPHQTYGHPGPHQAPHVVMSHPHPHPHQTNIQHGQHRFDPYRFPPQAAYHGY